VLLVRGGEWVAPREAHQKLGSEAPHFLGDLTSLGTVPVPKSGSGQHPWSLEALTGYKLTPVGCLNMLVENYPITRRNDSTGKVVDGRR
jgi:hypothetical protein